MFLQSYLWTTMMASHTKVRLCSSGSAIYRFFTKVQHVYVLKSYKIGFYIVRSIYRHTPALACMFLLTFHIRTVTRFFVVCWLVSCKCYICLDHYHGFNVHFTYLSQPVFMSILSINFLCGYLTAINNVNIVLVVKFWLRNVLCFW